MTTWDPGGGEAVPGLRIRTVSPGPRADSWAYITAGCWSTVEADARGLEFVLTAPVRDERFADLLGSTAYYHADHHLGLEHSLPVGEPWLPGSHCDHLLISLPYPHGPDLEHCPLPDGHARILRALPVTAAETAYRREHGHNALERLFDEHAIVPTDPRRPSVA
ncbi:suppressor of fused domain protein [Streptomyces cellulosae]|uniref:suppressor of fused domain protein n=1 Tax=Streptomyces sp. P9-2 TaxID=3423201 RepID=UPI00335DF76F